MKAALTVLAVLLSLPLIVFSQEKTITILHADVVTFDTARVDQKELTHWLRLSPALGNEWGYLSPQSVQTCIATDAKPDAVFAPVKHPEYKDCDKQGDMPSVHNAKVNVAIIEGVLRELGSLPQRPLGGGGLRPAMAGVRSVDEQGRTCLPRVR